MKARGGMTSFGVRGTERDLVAPPFQGQTESLPHSSRPDDRHAWLRHGDSFE